MDPAAATLNRPDIWLGSVSLLVSALLGAVVLWANPAREANRWFSLMAVLSGGWLLLLLAGVGSRDTAITTAAARACHGLGFLYMTALARLVSCLSPGPDRGAGRWWWWWWAADAAAAIACSGPWVVGRAWPPAWGEGPWAAPVPEYGPLAPLYAAALTAKIGWVILRLRGALRRATGVAWAEAGYLLLGGSLGMLFGLLVAVLLPMFVGRPEAIHLAPLAPLLMNCIIAYGVASRSLMGPGEAIRRAAAHLVVALCAGCVFGVLWWALRLIFDAHGVAARWWAAVVAAAVAAMTTAPVAGAAHEIFRRLGMGAGGIDAASALAGSRRLLRRPAPLEDAAREWVRLMRSVSGARFAQLCLAGPDRALGRPVARDGDGDPSGPPPALWAALARGGGPLLADMLPRWGRMAAGPELAGQMAEAGVAAAIPVAGDGGAGPAGALLLGARTSGRFYGSEEIEVLCLLCAQMALAIENARLFEEIAESRRQGNILLQNLSVGVIAAGPDGAVIRCNPEAARIVGIDAREAIGSPVAGLPAPLPEALGDPGAWVPAQVVLRRPAGDLPVRVSAVPFRADGDSRPGALAVLDDMSHFRAMEENLRRQDRLAALGSLAAAAAHEIRNPLVTVLAFVELSREGGDPAFVEEFSARARAELLRIEGIVSNMLQFGRLTPARRMRVSLRAEAARAAGMVAHRARGAGVAIRLPEEGPGGHVSGDPDAICQILLNPAINALDAMPGGGEIAFGVRESGARVVVSVADTGPGVPESLRDAMFDPFVSAGKHEGTGLGLSVAHGIARDHGATISLAPSGPGATFEVSFPAPGGIEPSRWP